MYTEAEKRKDRRLDVDRYEFLIYRLLRKALEAGNVYPRLSLWNRRSIHTYFRLSNRQKE
jgi:hypothetical protein